jgi:hypothetical protein
MFGTCLAMAVFSAVLSGGSGEVSGFQLQHDLFRWSLWLL